MKCPFLFWSFTRSTEKETSSFNLPELFSTLRCRTLRNGSYRTCRLASERCALPASISERSGRCSQIVFSLPEPHRRWKTFDRHSVSSRLALVRFAVGQHFAADRHFLRDYLECQLSWANAETAWSFPSGVCGLPVLLRNCTFWHFNKWRHADQLLDLATGMEYDVRR